MKYSVLLLLLFFVNKGHSQVVILGNCITKESVFDYRISGNGEPFKIGIDSINALYSEFKERTEKEIRTPNIDYYDAFFKLTVDSIGNAKAVDIVHNDGVVSNSLEELRLFILTLFPTNKVFRHDSRDGNVSQLFEFELSIMYNEDNLYKIDLSLPPYPEKREAK